jgi:hypothetical protein
MFVAIDRTSKFAFVELHENSRTATSRDFLLRLIKAVPYKIRTVLTDNDIQFTTPGGGGSAVPLIKEAMANGERFRAHAFEYACARNDIDHRTTKPRHPWTNGQVERMNRTIKEATVKRFYYETHDQLREHLINFVTAYNFAKRLKTLKGLTPYEYICKCWTKEPHRFISNPHHQTPGLDNAEFLARGTDKIQFQIRQNARLRPQDRLVHNLALTAPHLDSLDRLEMYGCDLANAFDLQKVMKGCLQHFIGATKARDQVAR